MVASESDCRQAAQELLGESVTSVLYLGLAADNRWDYGDWHWADGWVQFRTLSGRPFYATWDSQLTTFGLTSPRVRPRQSSIHRSPVGRLGPPEVDVSSELADHVLPHRARGAERPTDVGTVALRLATDSGVAWLVAAAPKEFAGEHTDIRAKDVQVGWNEVIVLFDDARAEHLGLRAVG